MRLVELSEVVFADGFMKLPGNIAKKSMQWKVIPLDIHFRTSPILNKHQILKQLSDFRTVCRSIGIKAIVFTRANVELSRNTLVVVGRIQAIVTEITVLAQLSTINVNAIPSECVACAGRSVAIAAARRNVVIVVVVIVDDVIR